MAESLNLLNAIQDVYGLGTGYDGAPAYGAQKSGSDEAEIMRLQERVR